MEILSFQDKQSLIGFFPYLKSSLPEWYLVDIRLTQEAGKELSVTNAADQILARHKDQEGQLYVWNDREILMLLRKETTATCSEIADMIGAELPPGCCYVDVREPTVASLKKLETLIGYKRPTTAATLSDTRFMRRENVVLVADDDMYMRTLVRKALGTRHTIHEIENGNDIITIYRKIVPDVLFLDLHMPGKNGAAALKDILALDPQAYVIMLTADSSLENVERAVQLGAKGFMVKPFSPEKLRDYADKCPTIF